MQDKMNKQDLKLELLRAKKETIDWLNSRPEDQFNEILVEDKWPVSHHIYHLIKSTKGVSMGMGLNKLILRFKFGINNRDESTYSDLHKKYLLALDKLKGKPIPRSFESETGRVFKKVELIERFEGEINAMVSVLDKWNEKQLSKYVLPHPVIGKLTIREFSYFTILHTYHHLDNLKKNYVR